jgi:ArsR family transcriptional regulator
MNPETILDILGNRTRRDIIKLVSQEPRYISELKRETGVEKMALSRHLDRMMEADVLKVEEETGKRGRPRKYYDIPGRLKLKVVISPDNFHVRVDEPRVPERDGIYDLRVKGAGTLKNPLERLVALSEIADDLQKEIRFHEEAIHRLEGTLSRIRKMGRGLAEEMEMDKVDGRIMVEIMLSEKGSNLEEISTGVRESSETVRAHLGHLRDRHLVEYRDSRWTVK